MDEREQLDSKKNLLEGILLDPQGLTAINTQETSVRIKALLMLRNVSQAEIAEKYKISKSDLCKVINGKRRTKHIREAIATELKIEFKDIWRKF